MCWCFPLFNRVMSMCCFCTGLFWWKQGLGDTVLAAQNSNGLLFFEMLFLAFRAMCVLPWLPHIIPAGKISDGL